MTSHATADAAAFSQALEQVCKVPPRRTSVPILSEVCVSFDGVLCTLTGTDLDTWLIRKLPASGEAFSFVLCRTREAAKVCRLLEGPLTLELNDTGEGKLRQLTVCISCGGRKMEFDAMDSADYPHYGSFEVETTFSANAAALRKRVARVGYAAADPSDGIRANICSVQFSGSRVYALDGQQLACDTDETLVFPRPFMVCAEPLSYLQLFGDAMISVELGVHRGQITDGVTTVGFSLNGVDLYDVDGALPRSWQEEISFSTKEFWEELSYLKKFAGNERKPYVRFDGGFLFLPTASGKCRTRIGLDGHSGIVFAFDLNKMMRAVQQFKGEPVLTMKVNNAVAPILIGAAGRSDFALVCPVRLSDRLMAA